MERKKFLTITLAAIVLFGIGAIIFLVFLIQKQKKEIGALKKQQQATVTRHKPVFLWKNEIPLVEEANRKIKTIKAEGDRLNTKTLERLADAYNDAGDLKNAAATYQKIIELSPKNPTIYLKLGNVQNEKHLYQEASENYQKSIKLQPEKNVAFLKLANLYFFSLRNHKKAAEVLEKAITKNPLEASYRLRLGDFYKLEKDYDKALFFYQSALKIDPKNKVAPLNIITVLRLKKQTNN